MTYRYTVGGIALLVDEQLPGLVSTGFADAELSVEFVQTAELAQLNHHGIRHVAGPDRCSGAIDPGARRCWLPTPTNRPEALAWQVRQMAPIFSAVLGRLVLHASAVEIGGQVVGFVGGTGSGKSTLAEFLAGKGRALASDDLLPIRLGPEPRAPVEQRLRPIGALFLLSRADTPSTTTRTLSETEALQALVHNGFGEHGDRDAWAMQFDAYHRLATEVPIFDFTIPDDRNALDDVEASLTALAGQGFRPADPNRPS